MHEIISHALESDYRGIANKPLKTTLSPTEPYLGDFEFYPGGIIYFPVS